MNPACFIPVNPLFLRRERTHVREYDWTTLGFGAPMKGLQVTVDHTTEDVRAEGLIRDLEHAMDTDDATNGR